ncbi:hypothetical protein BH20ACI2_BH20ACI2_22660 [soil metagenome]
MGPEIKYSLPVDADTAITHIRQTLLILAQTGEISDLSSSRRSLLHLREQAESDDRQKIAAAIRDGEAALESLMSDSAASPSNVYVVLDKIALIEAALLNSSLHSDDFLDDLDSLVEASFDVPATESNDEPVVEDRTESFEIDEETLDIFRNEALELLAAIDKNLNVLLDSPSNTNAVWEIRRCAHTFKGAAGIVGFKNACRIAHKMEDLLDAIVGSHRGAGPQIIEFLKTAVDSLHAILSEKSVEEDGGALESRYAEAIAGLTGQDPDELINSDHPGSQAGSLPSNTVQGPREPTRTPALPVVRVSINRLVELLEISRTLTENNTALAETLSGFAPSGEFDTASKARMESLLEKANDLNQQLHTGLQRIRMVRFGTLETRLSRAVNATCVDEYKKAVLALANGDVEIDTLIIDALIEPLLHLLKNAVVHGIESPETRRLIGKPEAGTITVQIEADPEALVLTVSDDGGGISVARLKESAMAHGLITDHESAVISDRDALELVFAKGLTTSDKIDLNAGRGVGMAIVKESVEARGGAVLVESQMQNGTTFTIVMPLSVPVFEPPATDEAGSMRISTEVLDPLVLIVDDSASIRNQAVKIIENAGYRTITANNGAEALELLLSSKWEPDLILSDVEMPQINGWQFLEYVKTDDNFGGIPVVMITSLDLPKYRKRAMDLGACDYIVKPVNTTDLERVCRQYVSRA